MTLDHPCAHHRQGRLRPLRALQSSDVSEVSATPGRCPAAHGVSRIHRPAERPRDPRDEEQAAAWWCNAGSGCASASTEPAVLPVMRHSTTLRSGTLHGERATPAMPGSLVDRRGRQSFSASHGAWCGLDHVMEPTGQECYIYTRSRVDGQPNTTAGQHDRACAANPYTSE